MSDKLVLVEEDDGVLVVTLNRPDRLNALNVPLHRALNEVLEDAARRREIRCVVLTGAGRGFCAGGDLNAIAERDPSRPTSPPPAGPFGASAIERRVDRIREHAIAPRLLHEMPKPTIAMVNGPCAGAGLSLAAACDLRLASVSAVFKAAFTRVGLSGDSGGSWFWTQILGTAKARRLYLLNERFDAQAALEFGLVSHVIAETDLRSQTLATARDLASAPRAALRFCKEVLNAAEDGSLEQVLDLEALAQAVSGSGRN